MTTNKVLQTIRRQPLLFAAIAITISAIVVVYSMNRPRTRPVYQWERDSDALKKQIDQFSDLAQPSKKP